MDVISINHAAWIIGNLLAGYVTLGVAVFVLVYYVLFDPKATTAGKFIFRFMLSLIGVMFLVFIGIYIDPTTSRQWTEPPPGVAVWRPVVRVVIYAYVAFTITGLSALLWVRKWRPERVKSAKDRDLVETRIPPHTREH